MFWFCELKNYFSSLAQREEKRTQAETFFSDIFCLSLICNFKNGCDLRAKILIGMVLVLERPKGECKIDDFGLHNMQNFKLKRLVDSMLNLINFTASQRLKIFLDEFLTIFYCETFIKILLLPLTLTRFMARLPYTVCHTVY